jgi:(S)-sulfolactate dehydrogenase
MKIVISEFMDEAAVAQLQSRFDVVYDPTLVDQPDALAAQLQQAQALIVRNRTQVRAALLQGATQVRVVGRLGVGLDNIDTDACEQRGIQVIPATGANSQAVAEYVIGTSMMLLRGAYQSSPQVVQGQWPRTALSSGCETGGKTLGLIGFGGIGRLTARLAHGLGMHVLAFDPALAPDAAVWQETGVQPRELSALLAESDVVSLHVPLVQGTRNLLNAERLAQMKAGALLINTARGGIVDETALAQALRSGHLGGAAIDVFSTEPVPADNPFHNVPNLLLTPHIAGVTRESNTRVSQLIADRVSAALLA